MMTKAYDFKDLVARFKKSGIDNAEEIAVDVYRDVIAWIKESAALTATPFDDMAAGFSAQLDAVVLPQIDKISDNVDSTP